VARVEKVNTATRAPLLLRIRDSVMAGIR
jgi:hypothetical protein